MNLTKKFYRYFFTPLTLSFMIAIGIHLFIFNFVSLMPLKSVEKKQPVSERNFNIISVSHEIQNTEKEKIVLNETQEIKPQVEQPVETEKKEIKSNNKQAEIKKLAKPQPVREVKAIKSLNKDTKASLSKEVNKTNQVYQSESVDSNQPKPEKDNEMFKKTLPDQQSVKEKKVKQEMTSEENRVIVKEKNPLVKKEIEIDDKQSGQKEVINKDEGDKDNNQIGELNLASAGNDGKKVAEEKINLDKEKEQPINKEQSDTTTRFQQTNNQVEQNELTEPKKNVDKDNTGLINKKEHISQFDDNTKVNSHEKKEIIKSQDQKAIKEIGRKADLKKIIEDKKTNKSSLSPKPKEKSRAEKSTEISDQEKLEEIPLSAKQILRKRKKNKSVGNKKNSDNHEQEIVDLTEGLPVGVKGPQLTKQTALVYPEQMRKRGIEGKVVLKVKLNAAGKPVEVLVNETSEYQQLDKAAKETVFGWNFKPGIKDGKEVSCWILLPIIFKLK